MAWNCKNITVEYLKSSRLATLLFLLVNKRSYGIIFQFSI
nr:MAG TPA: hypothetical protein [Bacteriophage sp.]